MKNYGLIRLKDLPYKVSEDEIINFLGSFKIMKEGMWKIEENGKCNEWIIAL